MLEVVAKSFVKTYLYTFIIAIHDFELTYIIHDEPCILLLHQSCKADWLPSHVDIKINDFQFICIQFICRKTQIS